MRFTATDFQQEVLSTDPNWNLRVSGDTACGKTTACILLALRENTKGGNTWWACNDSLALLRAYRKFGAFVSAHDVRWLGNPLSLMWLRDTNSVAFINLANHVRFAQGMNERLLIIDSSVSTYSGLCFGKYSRVILDGDDCPAAAIPGKLIEICPNGAVLRPMAGIHPALVSATAKVCTCGTQSGRDGGVCAYYCDLVRKD